jgi:hypothetical protein
MVGLQPPLLRHACTIIRISILLEEGPLYSALSQLFSQFSFIKFIENVLDHWCCECG